MDTIFYPFMDIDIQAALFQSDLFIFRKQKIRLLSFRREADLNENLFMVRFTQHMLRELKPSHHHGLCLLLHQTMLQYHSRNG